MGFEYQSSMSSLDELLLFGETENYMSLQSTVMQCFTVQHVIYKYKATTFKVFAYFYAQDTKAHAYRSNSNTLNVVILLSITL